MNSYWGKIIGAFFGYLLGGPLGAVFGIFIGHSFDQGLASTHYRPRQGSGNRYQNIHRAQQAFFQATFSVMGHVAKSDGRVSEDEIRLAKQVMTQMQLSGVQRQEAIRFFNAGKQPQFNLNQAINELLRYCGQQTALLKLFIEIQYQAAMADGAVGPNKKRILDTLSSRLGFTPFAYQDFGFNFNQRQRQSGNQHRSRQQYYQAPRDNLSEAYRTLEINNKASDADVKKAYRKLMSQNHPDKLIAKGLPEEMIKLATNKTQKIQAAYEAIREARGAHH